jgi:hypothetical protein
MISRLDRAHESRVPLTITLDPASYAFVEDCAGRREFRSVDEFFEAALAIYRQHLEALQAYVEMQEAKGVSLDEVRSSTHYEIVFTRHAD